MPAQKIEESPNDFLTRQLLARSNIVTYRSLSRDLEIHVNRAKNELSEFYAREKQGNKSLAATYMISGEVADDDDAMDVDIENRDSEPVKQFKMIMVAEKNLEHTKAKFATVTSIYIHSLSPAPIKDAGMLNEANDHVRTVDISKGQALSKVVGRLSSNDVKLKAPKAAKKSATAVKSSEVQAESSKSATAIVSKPPKMTAPTPSLTVDNGKGKEKEKPTGKMMDFFSKKGPPTKGTAKVTTTKEKAAPVKKVKVESRPPTPTPAASDPESDPSVSKLKISDHKLQPGPAKSKRGVKRKSNAREDDSDTESAPAAAPSKPSGGGRVKKGVVLSSDEEEDEVASKVAPTKRKTKGRAVIPDSDDEDTRSLMDVFDNDNVVNASIQRQNDMDTRSDAAVVDDDDEEEEEENDDQDVDMEDDTMPAAKRAKKVKKVVPVGKNGLKKKRVMKQRKTKDSKGYRITEDYSSYESVSEEEEEEEKLEHAKPKKRGSAPPKKESTPVVESKKKAPVKSGSTSSMAKKEPAKKAKAASKGAANGKGKQKDLSSFFGK